MKKCCIVTFNQAVNYGAVLQMYALQKVIQDNLKIDCDVLNYQSDYFSKLYKKRTLKDCFDIRFWKNIILDNSPKKYNISGFKNFISNHVQLTVNIYDRNNIYDINNKYDIFIAGSDQVFNPLCSGNDDNFFLNFVQNPNKKGSYAASLGFSQIPDECKEIIMTNLKCFRYLSIREQSSADSLSKLIDRKDIEVNIDPTLLINQQKWNSISKPQICIQNKYVLLYAISEDKKMIEFAKSIAKTKKCKVVYLTDRYLKPCGIKCISNITPEQWIHYFLNSEYVVTNSFHGIAFAINFNKQFYPYLLQKEKIINTRIIDLLRLFKLDYLLKHQSKKIMTIDYSTVNTILEKEREASMQYLKKMLI